MRETFQAGIEPVFAYSYTRKVRLPDGGQRSEEVVDYAVALFREKFGADAELPEYFVNAQTLTPEAHVAMQAAAQEYIDSAISKTINVPENIAFEEFDAVYRLAYEQGCKGCTTYRPNAVTGSVLSATETKPGEKSSATAEDAPPPDALGMASEEPLGRPETLPGVTYKLKWPPSPHAMYITLNDIIVDGQRRPFEVFINSKNMEHYAWTVALTRMVSAVFRRGGDVRFVVEELKAVFDPRGGAWLGGKYVPSILAAIGGVVERHLEAIGFGAEGDVSGALAAPGEVSSLAAAEATTSTPAGAICPACGAAAMHKSEGCATCLECGHSECS